MAIENIAVVHTDMEQRGGLKALGVFMFSDISAITFDTDGNHQITALTDANGKLFELKQGTGSLTSTGTKEGGTIMFEHTVTAYIPNLSDAHLSAIDNLSNRNLVVMCQDYNDNTYAVGLSQKFHVGPATDAHNQMYARLSSVELSTGAALGDETGATITFTCSSGELPYLIEDAVTIDAAAGTFSIA
mgnify:FL=1